MRASASILCLFMGLVVVAMMTGGCITPLTYEQESDWRWQQWNPEYRPPFPDPGLGSR